LEFLYLIPDYNIVYKQTISIMDLKYEIIKKTRNLELRTFTKELHFNYIRNYHYTEIYLRAQILI